MDEVAHEGHSGLLIIEIIHIEALALQEVIEFQHNHICAVGQLVCNGGLAGALGSNHKENLREHGLLGLLEDLTDTLGGVDVLDLAEASVHLDHRLRQLLERTQSLLQSLLVVVLSLLY